MELGQGSLKDILSGARQYRVPLYQRPYSWERSDWLTLWGDVLTQYAICRTRTRPVSTRTSGTII